MIMPSLCDSPPKINLRKASILIVFTYHSFKLLNRIMFSLMQCDL